MSGPNYYAVDPLSSGTVARFTKEWSAWLKQHPGLRSYALIDAGFDEQGVAQYVARHDGEAVSLYARTDMAEELASVGPWLLALSDDPGMLAEQVRELAQLRGARPMLSFWGGYRSLEAMRSHFRSFLHVELQDGLRFLFRFADTRVIEVLVKVLKPEQEQSLWPRDLAAWVPSRVDGNSVEQLPGGDASQSALSGPLLIDARQFAALVDASEPDAIIHNLTQVSPNRFDGVRPSRVYEFVAEQLARARAHGVHDAPNLETYCLTAWLTGPRFDEQPDFGFAIVQAARAPGALAGLVAALPDHAWTQAGEIGGAATTASAPGGAGRSKS